VTGALGVIGLSDRASQGGDVVSARNEFEYMVVEYPRIPGKARLSIQNSRRKE